MGFVKVAELFQRRVEDFSGIKRSMLSLGSPGVTRYPFYQADLCCLCSLGLLVSETALDPKIDVCSSDASRNTEAGIHGSSRILNSR